MPENVINRTIYYKNHRASEENQHNLHDFVTRTSYQKY